MKNCTSCSHARHAGKPEMAGCKFWTEIYQGDWQAVTKALRKLNEKYQWGVQMEKIFSGREDLNWVTESLLKVYAPQPIFEGWADLDMPYGEGINTVGMTNFCVVVKPDKHCVLYQDKGEV